MIVPTNSATCRFKPVDYLFLNLRKENKFSKLENKVKRMFGTKRKRNVTSRVHKLYNECLHTRNMLSKFNVYGSVHRKNISIYIYIYIYIYPTRCNVTQFIVSGNCSTYFGWYHHPSSGAQTTVSTGSGICHTLLCSSNSSTIAAGSSNGVTNTKCCRYSCLRF